MNSTLTMPHYHAGKVSLSLASPVVLTGFYLAARLCFTYLFFTADPQFGAMVSSAVNLLFLLLVGFYTFGAKTVAVPTRQHPAPFVWVLAFLAFSFISLLWSETVSVAVALAYWLGMAADVAMVVLMLRGADRAHRSRLLIQGYVGGACFIAAVMWLSPTMEDLRPGNDDFFSPNAIGFTCAFGSFLAQYLARTNRTWNYAVTFLSISLLRSLSKTTIIAFVAGEVILLARDRTMQRRTKVMLLAGAGLTVAAFWNLITAYYLVYINAGNQAETLTGRIGIWSFVLDRAMERPWLGHGFHAFRNVIPPFGSFEAWHAHNELIQQFYAYGVVGIGLLSGLYLGFFLQIRRLAEPASRSIFTGVLVFILIRGLADTERFDLSFPLWSIALLSLTFFAPKLPSAVQS